MLPIVLCGCEKWSLASREQHRLNVFEKRVLRRIFGAKRHEVIGDWRNLHNDKFHNLHVSLNTIRMIKSKKKGMTGHVGRIEGNRIQTGFSSESQKQKDK
jgi:hypothetical protein